MKPSCTIFLPTDPDGWDEAEQAKIRHAANREFGGDIEFWVDVMEPADMGTYMAANNYRSCETRDDILHWNKLGGWNAAIAVRFGPNAPEWIDL